MRTTCRITMPAGVVFEPSLPIVIENASKDRDARGAGPWSRVYARVTEVKMAGTNAVDLVLEVNVTPQLRIKGNAVNVSITHADHEPFG